MTSSATHSQSAEPARVGDVIEQLAGPYQPGREYAERLINALRADTAKRATPTRKAG